MDGLVRTRLIPAGLVTLLLLSSCKDAEKAGAPAKPPGHPGEVSLSDAAIRTAGIQVEPVRQEPLDRLITLTGTLAAAPWTPEEQAAISEAEVADSKLRLAESRFARLSKLHEGGILPRQDLDVARAELDQARSVAAQADAKRANLGLPQEAVTLASTAKIWGLANLPEADLTAVAAGDGALVKSASFPGRAFRGKVVAVSRGADPQTRSFTVRIAIEDPANRLRPQGLATFELSAPGDSRPTIPSSAVLLEGDGSYVYIAEGRTFRKRLVRTRPPSSSRVSVLEGLSAGQIVVSHGAQILESERLKSSFVPAVD